MICYCCLFWLCKCRFDQACDLLFCALLVHSYRFSLTFRINHTHYYWFLFIYFTSLVKINHTLIHINNLAHFCFDFRFVFTSYYLDHSSVRQVNWTMHKTISYRLARSCCWVTILVCNCLLFICDGSHRAIIKSLLLSSWPIWLSNKRLRHCVGTHIWLCTTYSRRWIDYLFDVG